MKKYIIIVLAAASAVFFIIGERTETLQNKESFPEKPGLIKVSNIKINQRVESPLLVRGEARGYWFFETSFPVKIYDDNDFLLGLMPAQALSEWMTEDFVPYEITIPFAVPSTLSGKVVLQKDNPSGLPEHDDELTIPIYFKETEEAPKKFMASKIFLSDSRFVNEPYFDCSKTIAVQRQVFKTTGVAKAAIEALLRGATRQEADQGFISTINPGVRVQKLSINDGTAKIDFDTQLEYQVGGSCRVAAIRAQITDTLKQFPTVQDVVISINGRTEDILQP